MTLILVPQFKWHCKKKHVAVWGISKQFQEFTGHDLSLHEYFENVHAYLVVLTFLSLPFMLASFLFDICFVFNSLKSCEPEFLVSTPERLLELISMKAIDISGVSMLVGFLSNIPCVEVFLFLLLSYAYSLLLSVK